MLLLVVVIVAAPALALAFAVRSRTVTISLRVIGLRVLQTLLLSVAENGPGSVGWLVQQMRVALRRRVAARIVEPRRPACRRPLNRPPR